MAKTYTLLGTDGPYDSATKGMLGGNGRAKIYGRLDCGSALRALTMGATYAKHRVFFPDEANARAAGYRPCGNCMRTEYAAWKARQSSRSPRPLYREVDEVELGHDAR